MGSIHFKHCAWVFCIGHSISCSTKSVNVNPPQIFCLGRFLVNRIKNEAKIYGFVCKKTIEYLRKINKYVFKKIFSAKAAFCRREQSGKYGQRRLFLSCVGTLRPNRSKPKRLSRLFSLCPRVTFARNRRFCRACAKSACPAVPFAWACRSGRAFPYEKPSWPLPPALRRCAPLRRRPCPR